MKVITPGAGVLCFADGTDSTLLCQHQLVVSWLYAVASDVGLSIPSLNFVLIISSIAILVVVIALSTDRVKAINATRRLIELRQAEA
jgi:hypothetical protein